MATDEDRTTIARTPSPVAIRPIRPDDRGALDRAVELLSPESRYRRFLGSIKHLADSQLDHLVNVDHYHHEALVATSSDTAEIVGVARYVGLPADPRAAEVAIAVADAWQGRGLGTVLLEDLVARARAAGIQRFVATCLSENREAIDLLERLGPTREGRPDGGLVELSIELGGQADRQGAVRRALRHAAAGELEFAARGAHPGVRLLGG
jgi:RimJ/RimL family protein N-acetyltransferase